MKSGDLKPMALSKQTVSRSNYASVNKHNTNTYKALAPTTVDNYRMSAQTADINEAIMRKKLGPTARNATEIDVVSVPSDL